MLIQKPKPKPKIIIIYYHKDEKIQDVAIQLQTHLSSILSQSHDVFTLKDILSPGSNQKQKINQTMDQSCIIVPLLCINFINCSNWLMHCQTFWKSHHFIPILTSPCSWTKEYTNFPWEELTILPEPNDGNKFLLSDFKGNLQKTYANIAKSIRAVALQQLHLSTSTLQKWLTEKISVPSSSYLSNIVSNYPIIDNIHAQLKHHQCLILQGIGGSGKSRLTYQYWLKYQKQYDHIAWINCHTCSTSPNQLSIKQILCHQLQPFIDQDPTLSQTSVSNLPKSVIIKLQNFQGNNLLILDHFSSTRQYIPISLDNWKVIVTTRIHPPIGVFPNRYMMYLDQLTYVLAKQLFCKYHPRFFSDEEEKKLAQLLHILQYNPLNIEIVAKYCEHVGLPYYSLNQLFSYAKESRLLQLIGVETLHLALPFHPNRFHYMEEPIGKVLAYLFPFKKLSKDEQSCLQEFCNLPSLGTYTLHHLCQTNLFNESEQKLGCLLRKLAYKGWLTKQKQGDDTGFALPYMHKELICYLSVEQK